MKILIGYDGSPVSESALDNLKLAGLPDNTEAVVLTVAEVWLPPENTEEAAGEIKPNPFLEQLAEKHRQKGQKAVSEAEALARHVVEMCDAGKAEFKPLYPDNLPLRDKVKTIATEIYRAADISCDASVEARFKELQDSGYGHLPVCMKYRYAGGFT
jgi:formyltetrahydrofolate synthetase